MCVVETVLDEATHNVQIVNASASLVVQGVPSPPTIDSVSLLEAHLRYKVYWRPGTDNNAELERFTIQYITDWDDTNWVIIEEVPADGSSEYYDTITLDPYVTYTLRVIAHNAIGESEPSPEMGLPEGRTPLSTPPSTQPASQAAAPTPPLLSSDGRNLTPTTKPETTSSIW